MRKIDDYILKTEGLSKVYKGIAVVNKMSVEIAKGRIYGLIGKNGAGKTTFIRMVAGLARPNAGKLWLYGEDNPERWYMARKKMSFIVEAPYIHPYLTAYENLKEQSLQKGIKDEKRIKEMLEIVNLATTGKKKAGNFSLGMRQRLGIAIAMLSSPEFLMLDEPLNGLDPEGMLDMRNLLLQLRASFGTTILISSHLLSELYQIATDYIIMHEGKVIEQITAEVLDERCSDYLLIKVDDCKQAMTILTEKMSLQKCMIDTEGYIRIYDKEIDEGKIAKALVMGGMALRHMAYNKSSLEQYFLNKIGGKIDA